MIPAFSSLLNDSIFTPSLVDTAGFNEVGQVDLQHMVKINLQTAAAYIYVMSYTELRNEQDYEAFKAIMERDKSKTFSACHGNLLSLHFPIKQQYLRMDG